MKKIQHILYVVLFFVIIPLFLYFFSIRNAIQLYLKEKQLAQETKLIRNSSTKSIIEDTTYILPLISNGKVVNLIAHDIIKEGINARIIKYEPIVIDSIQNYTLYKGCLEMTGDYISLIRVLSYIETQLKSKIISSHFYLNKQLKSYTFEEKLHLKIILTQIEGS